MMVATQSKFPTLANPDNKICHLANESECYDHSYFIKGETAEYFIVEYPDAINGNRRKKRGKT